ncbi:MAG: hypothetical protein AAF211_01145 [Myxococcota bacterium]
MMPVLLMVLACGSDSASRSASTYVGQLQPLLQENSLLAERVLFQAAAIYNNAARPDDVANKWETDITPIAEHLHFQAKLVPAPEEWSETHEGLVEIWGDRARAYRDISEGLRQADREAWDRGSTAAEEVKLEEEDWFDKLNDKLGAMNVNLDPYP